MHNPGALRHETVLARNPFLDLLVSGAWPSCLLFAWSTRRSPMPSIIVTTAQLVFPFIAKSITPYVRCRPHRKNGNAASRRGHTILARRGYEREPRISQIGTSGSRRIQNPRLRSSKTNEVPSHRSLPSVAERVWIIDCE